MKRTLSLLILGFALANPVSADLFSEFQPNPVGTDPTTVPFELSGTPGASFNLWILSIESDASSAFGTIDRASNVSGTYDANGLAVVDIDDLENPSFTALLTDTFTGTIGDSIDTNSDGIVDTTYWNVVEDALGIPDTGGEFLYGAQLGGQDFAFTGDEPQLVFRDSVTGGWYAINDPAGTDAFDINANAVAFSRFNQDPSVATFGSANPFASAVIPEPGSGLLGALLVGLGLARRRRT
jgi:MYXO-CTERM domain-containing protein